MEFGALGLEVPRGVAVLAREVADQVGLALAILGQWKIQDVIRLFAAGYKAQEGGAIARLSILQQHTNGIAVTELSKRIALKTTGALKRLSRLKQHSIAGIASTNTQMNWRGH